MIELAGNHVKRRMLHDRAELLDVCNIFSNASAMLRGRGLRRRQTACRPGLDRKMDHRDHQESDIAKGFELLPRRWVVECTFAWLGRCRRLAKDFEVTSAVALIYIAHIRRLVRA